MWAKRWWGKRKKSWEKAEKTTSNLPQHVVLLSAGNRTKISTLRLHTHSHTLMLTHSQLNECAHSIIISVCLAFASLLWATSCGSPQLSVLFSDSCLKGRMDVPSRQGHETDNERREWWWQKRRGREKTAGVTTSTCSPQLSEQRMPGRRNARE